MNKVALDRKAKWNTWLCSSIYEMGIIGIYIIQSYLI